MSTPVLLFTDIEGSTALWLQHPDAMQGALTCHDDILRTAVVGAGGTIFKHTGDGCCASFDSVARAARAAVEAQRALGASAWGEIGRLRSRMAIHVGEAEPRDDDWFGPALNRCARLLSTGHGGQVLVSGVAQALLAEMLPEEWGLRDLGVHRLRDLALGEHVWQLLAPGLEGKFPPLRSLDAFRGNLPSQLSRFIGRERDQHQLYALLSTERLVTLVGPGGMGKTRLALQVGAAVLDRFPDGVWLIELAPFGSQQDLAHPIVATLGLQSVPSASPSDLLVESLRSWRALLVVDNCEHVVEGARRLVADVLSGCPDVQVLATSRAPLRVAGERVHQVAPLAAEHDALALFADRAAAVKPGFELDEGTRGVTVRLCRALDGMPLAIELAAARMRSMTASELVERLGQRFRLLHADARSGVGRHATLEGLIAWSDDLLSADEQRLFRSLAVFSDGFDLAGAHAVHAAPGADELDTLDLLDALVAQSLVQATDGDTGTRYSVLETIRQFCTARWTDDDRHSLPRRHALHLAALAEEADIELAGPEQVRWLRRLEAEHDNLRAALAWACSPDGDAHLALRLAVALAWFWRVHSHLAEGRRWLQTALAMTEAPAGMGTTMAGAPSVRGPELRARALFGAGLLAYAASDFASAGALLDEGLQLATSAGADGVAGWACHGLGRVALERDDAAAGARHLEASMALFERADDARGRAYTTMFLGALAMRTGDATGAEERFASAEAQLRSAGDAWGLAALLTFSAAPALARGDVADGARRYGEALGLNAELGTAWMAAQTILGLAHAARLGGQWADSVRLRAAAEALRTSLGVRPRPEAAASDRPGYLMLGHDAADVHARELDEARDRLGPDAFRQAWREGSATDLAGALELAVAVATEIVSAADGKRVRSGPLVELTPREEQVLAALAQDRSNKEVARELGISVRTVENHLAHIYLKLGVQGRVGAVLAARELS